MDAAKGQKKPSERIAQALEDIKVLYQVEALAKGDLPDGQMRHGYIYELRQKHSVPVRDAFKTWLDTQAPLALPKSLLGRVIGYARNQWQYMSRYVEDGQAPIDNNVLERDIRPLCTGRNTWLFSDTVAGAEASAMIYSMMLTCRANDVEPYGYLLNVLDEMPRRATSADISDFLPFNYVKRPRAAKP